jgi:hypothetical protein
MQWDHLRLLDQPQGNARRILDDLKVPAENVIGGEGLGYKIAIKIFYFYTLNLPLDRSAVDCAHADTPPPILTEPHVQPLAPRMKKFDGRES